MISKELLPPIQEEIQTFFRFMGSEPEIRLEIADETVLRILLRMENPGLYIGHGGEGLFALQHLLRLLLQRKTGERFFVDLDVNDYKEAKITSLRDLAREIADEVALTKKEKELPPMSAYERRIIHLELAGRADVTTESIGEGADRRVMIRPVPSTAPH
jgi:spoIIIJ-associated protein